MSSKARDCILLDMGKVLLDFDFKHFGDRILDLTGVNADLLDAAVRGDLLARRYESGLISDRDFHKELCRRIGKEVSWIEFVAAWNSIFYPVPILPEDLIKRLATHASLWLVSNTNNLHFDFILGRFSFLRYFSGFTLSHEVGALKPDPQIFVAALQRAGVKPLEALFVDDQIANVQAARDLGMDAFQFLNPKKFAQEMESRGIL